MARLIATSLAAKPGPLVPLIAETGGQNALIADSSALPEQVVRDVIASAFNSAGQRCSALRVLFVQADIADKVIAMLARRDAGTARRRSGRLRTDVGPVIDEDARSLLEAHARKLEVLCHAHPCRAVWTPTCRRMAPSSRRAPTRSTASRGSSAKCSARSCT